MGFVVYKLYLIKVIKQNTVIWRLAHSAPGTRFQVSSHSFAAQSGMPGGNMKASLSPGVISGQMPAHLPHRSHLSKLICKKQNQNKPKTKPGPKKFLAFRRKLISVYLAKIKHVFQPIIDFNGFEHTSYYDPGRTKCWLCPISGG